MAKIKFGEILLADGLIRGPFGSDMKKSLFVNESKDAIKVLTQENVFEEDQNLGSYFITKDYFERMKRFEVLDKDFLITCDGTLGRITFIDTLYRKSVINSSLLIIRVDPTKVDYWYFYYFWKFYLCDAITKRNVNSCLKHLPSLDVIKAEEIDIPNIEEQKRIAIFLRQYDKKINCNKRVVDVLSNKIKDSLSFYYSELEKVDYKTVVLEKYVEPVNKPYDSSEIVPLIDLSIMESGSLLIKNLSSSDKFDTNLKVMEKGNILFGSIRPYLKKCCLAFKNGAVTGTVIQFKVKEKGCRNFIFANMISDSFFNYAVNYSTGTKMPVVKSKDLLKFPLKINDAMLNDFENKNDYMDLLMTLLDENVYLDKIIKTLAPLLLDKKLILE